MSSPFESSCAPASGGGTRRTTASSGGESPYPLMKEQTFNKMDVNIDIDMEIDIDIEAGLYPESPIQLK